MVPEDTERRWAATFMSFKSVSLYCCCLYLVVSHGMPPINVAILSQIGLLLSLLKEPVVIVGDFQMIEEELIACAETHSLYSLRRES